MRKAFFTIFINVLAFGAIANEQSIIVPDEFKSLFSNKPTEIKFVISGLNDYIHISMVSNPFDASLSSDEQSDDIKSFLIKHRIIESFASDIVNGLTEGIVNDSQCSGIISECQLIPSDYAFAYDYENQTIKLFVSAKALTNETQYNKVPEHSFNEFSGVINHVELDVNSYDGNDTNVTVRNDTIVGLNYGNVKSKIYFNSDDDIDVDQLAYDYEWDSNRIQIGHFNYGYSQNTTGDLELTSSFPQNVITLSSSNNLTKNTNDENRNLVYSLPGQGRIEIYRDSQLVFSRNVGAGQQFINYSDIPSGNYLATVVVISQGREVLREERQIYNSGRFSLDKGEIDYSFSIGQFESRYDDSSFDELELANNEFVDGRLNYQLFENASIGLRGVSSNNNYLVEGYVNKEFSSYSNIDAKYAAFDNSSYFFSLNSSILGLSFGYDSYNLDNEEYELNNYLLGNTGYKRITVTSSISAFGGSGYVMFTNNDAESETKLGEEFRDQTDYWSVTSGYSHSFVADSIVDVSISYQGSNDDVFSEEEWYASLLWSVPLGSEWTASSSTSLSSKGVDEFRNSVMKSIDEDEYSVSSELGIAYNGGNAEQDVTTDISLTGTFENDKLNGDAYTYARSDGTRSLNIGLSSSQIYNGNSVSLSSYKSDAYAIISSSDKKDDDSYLGLLTVKKNNELNSSKNLEEDKTVISLDNYGDYYIELDSSSSNYLADSKNAINAYVFPGSVIPLSVKLEKIKTFIVSFEDINSKQIDEIKCVGEGCVDVEVLTEGVFKISVIVGSEYQLVSNSQTCITPSLSRNTSKVVNIGINQCLPGIYNESLQLASLKSSRIGDSLYYFIGFFDNDDTLLEAKKEIDDIGIELVSYTVDSRTFLYAKTDQMLSSTQVTKLEEIWRYASKVIEYEPWATWSE